MLLLLLPAQLLNLPSNISKTALSSIQCSLHSINDGHHHACWCHGHIQCRLRSSPDLVDLL
jgi:hypothetical protein